MTAKPYPEMNQLAAEALDLWQEHLATLAADPKAKSDLAHIMEPSRRMFAEWMEKAQNGQHGFASFTPPTGHAGNGPATNGSAPVAAAPDDGALRIAQLALHVAELERRVAKLESRKPRAAAKAASASRRDE